MAHYFFDSSALVKWYVAEAGTRWVGGILNPHARHAIHIVRITGVEVVAALGIRSRLGTMTRPDARAAITQFKTDFRRLFQITDVSDILVEEAMLIAERHDLRAIDSVQLAAALALQEMRKTLPLPSIAFVSADGRLNAAAAAEGLLVEDPNTHS